MMRWPSFRLRTLLLAVAMAAPIMAGVAMLVRHPGRPYTSAFNGLDPVALLGSRPGYAVASRTTWNVFNTKRGYAYREWRGVVTTGFRAPCGRSRRRSRITWAN